MPSKIVKPVDSLVNISSYILAFLENSDRTLDEILAYVNQNHYKAVSIEKKLCLNFLFLLDKIENYNEIIKIKL